MTTNTIPTWTEDDPELDQRTLDELVDGTLDLAARREVLLKLESTPDAWRRCALAFLEDQTWRQVAGTLSGTVARPTTQEAGTPLPPLPNVGASRWPALLARAASLLVAFGLGAWIATSQASRPLPSTEEARPRTTPPPLVDPDVEQSPVPSSLAADGNPSPPATVPRPADHTAPPGEQLAQAPGRRERIEEQLQRHGFKLEPRGGYLPVSTTADGRSIRVPFEDYQVRYVGNRIY